MATNRGKQFEEVVKESFLKVSNTSVVRLPDPTNGYLGIRNISDFIVYHYPNQYFIECKSVHGNTLPFSNITENQWNGMLEMSNIKGVIAGVICWWIDKDITLFISIQMLQAMKNMGKKSIRYDEQVYCDSSGIGYAATYINGTKKRIFFDYDMEEFFNGIRARANS